MYYTISIILGTVAFSYGSVPMYKMVGCPRGFGTSFLTRYRSAKPPDGAGNLYARTALAAVEMTTLT